MTRNPPATAATVAHTVVPSYRPEPGSLADRVLQLLQRQPDEEYTSGDLTLKFSVPPGSCVPALKWPVHHGLLVHTQDQGDSTKTWRAGPRFKVWAAAQQLADTAPPQKATGRGGRRIPLPDLKPEQVAFAANRPKPPKQRFSTAGDSKYGWIFDQLTKPGMCAELPTPYLGTITTQAKKRSVGGLKFSVQRVSVDRIGLWRDA